MTSTNKLCAGAGGSVLVSSIVRSSALTIGTLAALRQSWPYLSSFFVREDKSNFARVGSLRDWQIEANDSKATLTVTMINKTSKHRTPALKFEKAGGMHCPGFLSHSRLHWLARNCKLRAGDVVICTYPKCGTTWTEQIVLLLLNDGNPARLNPETKNTYTRDTGVGKIWPAASIFDDKQYESMKATRPPHGEFALRLSPDEFDSVQGRRVIKQHMPRKHFQGQTSDGKLQPGVKVVYVTRNPLDACVSAYNHPGKSAPRKEDRGVKGAPFPFSAYCKFYLDVGFAWGSWFAHNKGWRIECEKNPKQVLWVTYEGLHHDTEGEIKRIAEFLGLDVTKELLKNVATHSTLSSMKKQAAARRSSASGATDTHLKSGKIGKWRQFFTQEMYEDFLGVFNEEMKDFKSIRFDIGNGHIL